MIDTAFPPDTQAASPQQQKYFTRRHLIEVAHQGLAWDYNRQLSERIAEIPDGRFSVESSIVHSFRRGAPCEPHIRCVVSLAPHREGVVCCDVPIRFYEALPTEMVSRK